MAVLGAQLVLTLLTLSVIQKISPHFSFAKWLLCATGLYRYLHPSDDELRTLAGVPKEKHTKGGGKGNKGYETRNGTGQFHIPRNLEVQLETTPVVARDVVHLRYYTEYQWLVDFSVYAAVVYILSEVYHYYFPLKNEFNLSMIWCLLVVFFSLKLLSSLTWLYFQNEESIGERSMVIVACLVYLLIAMIVLIIDERHLETGLEHAYSSFNASASEFLAAQGLPSSGPASKLIVKLCMAVCCGLLGAIFTFPGLRMAKMHWDSLKYCSGRKTLQLLLNISFILPFLLIILWIRPISREYLTERAFEGMQKPLLSVEAFETMRLIIVVLVVLLRFALIPIYLQSYLNLAHDKIVDLRKEAGRITNVEYQKKISSIFYYLCVVTLQFAAPLLLCLYLTLMYKSLGEFTWAGILKSSNSSSICTDMCPLSEAASVVDEVELAGTTALPPVATTIMSSMPASDSGEHIQGEDFNILESANAIHAQWISLKNVFNADVYKGFLGFASWWSYFTLFTSSALGIVYQSYFSNT
ncbi:PREDICTED: transmembrane protein 161B [Bactrocera latifrons]|uniref:Transmembrane protein 161B n=2 Tax=Bactrocera latifrons TaxID=174628 RepID=A0A0K8VJL0_BACLA|nr:PREDICTED: transmembrane protein 161B [Bactrocera latifrons]